MGLFSDYGKRIFGKEGSFHQTTDNRPPRSGGKGKAFYTCKGPNMGRRVSSESLRLTAGEGRSEESRRIQVREKKKKRRIIFLRAEDVSGGKAFRQRLTYPGESEGEGSPRQKGSLPPLGGKQGWRKRRLCISASSRGRRFHARGCTHPQKYERRCEKPSHFRKVLLSP